MLFLCIGELWLSGDYKTTTTTTTTTKSAEHNGKKATNEPFN